MPSTSKRYPALQTPAKRLGSGPKSTPTSRSDDPDVSRHVIPDLTILATTAAHYPYHEGVSDGGQQLVGF